MSFSPFGSLSIWKSAWVNVFVSVQIISWLDSQSRFQMFTLLFFRLLYWRTKEVLHTTNISTSSNAHTLNLMNCLLYHQQYNNFLPLTTKWVLILFFIRRQCTHTLNACLSKYVRTSHTCDVIKGNKSKGTEHTKTWHNCNAYNLTQST